MAVMDPDDLRNHIANTYFGLRMATIALSVALPIALYAIGRWSGIGLLPSMSHYYAYGTGATRDWLVGTLCAVGIILYAYRGFTALENVMLNAAGVFAALTALVPCRCGDENQLMTPHGFFAVSFFLAIAVVVVKCGPDTLTLMPDADRARREKYTYTYWAIGAVMVASPLVAAALSARESVEYQFFLETVGTYTFASYWFVKSVELHGTDVETLAASGRLRRSEHGYLTSVQPVARNGEDDAARV